MSLFLKLLLRFIVGIIGKKLSFAIAAMILATHVARTHGAGRTLRRTRAWLRAMRRPRPPDGGALR